MKIPDVYIGDVQHINWGPDKEPDDDILKEETPAEVIQILGFDPKTEDI